MIQDEDLKNTHDYTKGQKKAAHRVLIELVNLFDSYKEDIRMNIAPFLLHINRYDLCQYKRYVCAI